MDPGQILPRKKRKFSTAISLSRISDFLCSIPAKILPPRFWGTGDWLDIVVCRGFLQSRVEAIENKWFQIVPFQTANHPWDPQAIKMQQYFSKMFLHQRSFRENVNWQRYCQFGNKPVHYDWLAGGMFTKIYSCVCSHNHNEVGRHC